MKSRRTRLSAAEWERVLAEFRSSGLSQAAFCEQRALNASTFQNWWRKLKGKTPFIEIPVTREVRTELEVSFADGTVVRIRG
jgi:transposase-like protein